jgi:hypothetical protein
MLVLVPRRPVGALPKYLADRVALRAELPIVSARVPKNAIVVADHGDEFMVTAETGLRAQSKWLRDLPRDNSHYWLIRTAGIEHGQFPADIVVLSRWAVMRQDVFFNWLQGLTDAQRTMIARENPVHVAAQLGIQ